MTGRGEYFGKSDGLVSPKDLAFYGKPVKHCYEFGKKTAKTPSWDRASTKLWLDVYSPCLKTPLTTFCLTTLMNFNHY